MWLRFETAADIETELTRDLNLSPQNRTMSKFPMRLTPNSREFQINQMGLEDPVYVSLSRDGEPDLIPLDIRIGDISMINSVARDGRLAVAFYGDKPQRGITSWTPDGTETITVWFDRSPDTDPSAEQATFTITDSYVPLLKLLLAAQMLELMKQPIGKILESRISNGMAQWKQYARRGKQQGVIKKTAYRPGRYRERGTNWSAFPGRVGSE